MKIRTPMAPIDVNVNVETVGETEKSKNVIANKGKKKITSRGDHSAAKQKEIWCKYNKKGKDLSKLKACIKRQKRQKTNTKGKVDFSMAKRKKMKTKAEREKMVKDQQTTETGKSPRTPKPKKLITKALTQARQKN